MRSSTALRRILHFTQPSAYSTAGNAQWSLPPPGTKVFTAVSGGVDSSVVARLLLEQGYDIQPVFMRNWDTLDESSGSGGCEWEQDWDKVQRLCRQSLSGVKPQLVDLTKEYWNSVFQEALDAWAAGVTPNPDVNCNQHIKFHELPARLFDQDPSAWLATGHYARLLPSPLDPTQPALHRSSFLPKDQSYYLSTAPLAALSRTMFPLGAFESKAAVRDLARKWQLPTAEQRESMGICFVGQRRSKFADFLEGYLESVPGDIVEHGTGRVVGSHGGLWRYTIGEGAKVGGLPEKMYVARKHVNSNTIVVAPKNSPALSCAHLHTRDFIWSAPQLPAALLSEPGGELTVSVQTRSLQAGSVSTARVRQNSEDKSLDIELLDPLWGVAPGQAVVLYEGTWCLGGGTIASTRTME